MIGNHVKNRTVNFSKRDEEQTEVMAKRRKVKPLLHKVKNH